MARKAAALLALVWLVAFPAPAAGSRYHVEDAASLMLSSSTACNDVKFNGEGNRLCPKVLQVCAAHGLKCTPVKKPGGYNSGLYEITGPGGEALFGKVTDRQADVDAVKKFIAKFPGSLSDPALSYPKEVIPVEHGFWLFLMKKAEGKEVQDRIPSELYGGGAPDGTFMKAVGRAIGKLYQDYCGGCGTTKACHGDSQAGNAVLSGQNKVTFIDLDNLNSQTNPKHDVLGMEQSIDILERGYKQRPEFFQQMRSSLNCGFEEVCPAGVPGRGQGVGKQCGQGGAAARAQAPAAAQPARAPAAAQAVGASYQPGQRVEYYSQSRRQWVAAVITAVLPNRDAYQTSYKPGVYVGSASLRPAGVA